MFYELNFQYKRSTDGIQVRGPYNSNKRSSYVELVLVVDNKVFKTMDKNFTKVHQHCKDIANIINAVRDINEESKLNIYCFFVSLLISALRSIEYFCCTVRRCNLVGTKLSRLVK